MRFSDDTLLDASEVRMIGIGMSAEQRAECLARLCVIRPDIRHVSILSDAALLERVDDSNPDAR
jgi:hypothetical protein